MTLTKAQIIDDITERLAFSRKDSADIVELLLEIMKKNLERGDDLLVSGFGKFCVKDKKPRRGRNPATGDDLMLEKRRVVTFKCSHVLRDKVNNSKN